MKKAGSNLRVVTTSFFLLLKAESPCNLLMSAFLVGLHNVFLLFFYSNSSLEFEAGRTVTTLRLFPCDWRILFRRGIFKLGFG